MSALLSGRWPRRALTLWLLAALLWFAPLNSPHLFDPDEGRYGEIPREMLVSGDWVTPRLDGIKYFEKPALQYWTTAAALKLFGIHEWSVRLWPALCGFLGILLTFAVARRLYDARVAALASLVQAGALLYLGLARFATLDMSLCFTLQIALTALLWLVQRPPPAAVWKWSLLLGLGMALAVLSKGLIGILIPGAVAVLFLLLYREPQLLWRAQPWWALLALLGVSAPWLLLVSQRNPEFAHFFFVVQHFQRFTSSTGFDRYQPVWFFIPVLLVGFLPWTPLLPQVLREAYEDARGGDRRSTLLLLWAGFVFVFFSISQSKLVPYIAPLLPALSLLTGRSLAQMSAPTLTPVLQGAAVISTALGLLVLLLMPLPLAAEWVAQASSDSLVGFAAAFLLLALGTGLGAQYARRGLIVPAVAAAAGGCLLFGQSALWGASQLPRMQRVTQLAAALQPRVGPSTRVFCVNDYVQPLPFYLGRPCTLVGYRGELDFGLQQEPGLWLPGLMQFAAVWQQQTDALAVLRPVDYQQLMAMGAPMRVIYTAPSFIAVVKP